MFVNKLYFDLPVWIIIWLLL